jgi:ubiquinone biosynthesis protein
MGMMGRMSEHDRALLKQAVEGIATNDIGEIQDAVMALGKFRGKPDPTRLYEDLAMFMAQYGKMEMKEIDIARILMELMEIMKKNHMSMPHGLTLLVRGLTQVEGVLAEISPEISVVEIAAARMRSEMYSFDNWQEELKSNLLGSYRSMKDLITLPTLTAKILRGYQKGQTRINLDLHSSDELSALLRHLVRNMVIGLCLAALLISSSIICLTDMWPKVLGIPLLGAAGYFLAIIISAYLVLRYFRNRRP